MFHWAAVNITHRPKLFLFKLVSIFISKRYYKCNHSLKRSWKKR